jgi:LmbE family N-acetylglucosaminyl deacetylase
VAELDVTVPTKAIAVFAHPDDPEVACGGTLATWARQGTEVQIVVVTRGEKGSDNADTDPDELAQTRLAELHHAANVMGVSSAECWGIDDGEVTNNLSLREQIIRLVRTQRPDVVLAPDPTSVFFGDHYVNHRDHRELGWAVLDAICPAAASPLYSPQCGSPHQVERLYLAGSLEPNVWVDIKSTLDVKAEALGSHRSQVRATPEELASMVTRRAADAGAAAGLSAAEAFRRIML